MTRSQLNHVKSVIFADDFQRHKDGTVTVRWEFFYTHGRTAAGYEEKILAAFPNAEIHDSGEVWKPFRGGATTRTSSHFWVRFDLK